MKTSRGIYLNLKESPFVYEKYGIKFYFSSEFYRKKFRDCARQFVDEENMKLEVRFKNPINAQLYLLLVFYRKVEKRGYRVIYNNIEYFSPPCFKVVL